jgi:hypothetical protein
MRKATGVFVALGLLCWIAATVAYAGTGGRHHRGAVVAWSRAEGRPNIPAGQATGFCVWHEGNDVFVTFTSQSAQGQRFSGTITVQDAEIVEPHGIKTEPRDGFRQPKPSTLEFRFDTHEQMDGVRFHLRLTDNSSSAPPPHGARSMPQGGPELLRFNLRLHGDATGKIFYGPHADEAKRDPVMFDLVR